MSQQTVEYVQIYAKDAASVDKLSSTLGTGAGALDNINAELKKQGLPQSTGVNVVATERVDNTGVIVGMSDSRLVCNLEATIHYLFVLMCMCAGVVVGCVGGGALIIAITVYYMYFVKPGVESASKDMQDSSIITSTSPVAPSRAFMDPPVAILGYTVPTHFEPAF